MTLNEALDEISFAAEIIADDICKTDWRVIQQARERLIAFLVRAGRLRKRPDGGFEEVEK